MKKVVLYIILSFLSIIVSGIVFIITRIIIDPLLFGPINIGSMIRPVYWYDILVIFLPPIGMFVWLQMNIWKKIVVNWQKNLIISLIIYSGISLVIYIFSDEIADWLIARGLW